MMNIIARAKESQVGTFHEIDYSKLSPRFPIQLKFVCIMYYLIGGV